MAVYIRTPRPAKTWQILPSKAAFLPLSCDQYSVTQYFILLFDYNSLLCGNQYFEH
jgi:hypothetical protein